MARLSLRANVQRPIRFPVALLEPAIPLPTRPPDPLAMLRASLDPSVAGRVWSGAELIATNRREQREIQQTMIGPLDRLLEGGIRRGKLTEIVGRRSTGRFSLALGMLAAMTSSGEAVALVDLGDHLDPDTAMKSGVELARLLWVRPETLKQALSSAEMLLTTGFPLVVLDLGLRVRGRADDAVWRRLARAATAHDSALVVSTPFHISGTSADAVVRTEELQADWQGRGRSPRLLRSLVTDLVLEKHRRIRPGRSERYTIRTSETITTPSFEASTDHSAGRNEPSAAPQRSAPIYAVR